MELNTAFELIKDGVRSTNIPQTWADLGSGRGLFTHALSMLLPPGSTIYAVDRDAAAVNSITLSPKVSAIKVVKDFVNDPLQAEPLDGILMANALHFVKDKFRFMKGTRLSLKPSGTMLIVEYDTETSNQWVPYPISYSSLERAHAGMGFTSLSRIGSTPSKYNRAEIYSAFFGCNETVIR